MNVSELFEYKQETGEAAGEFVGEPKQRLELFLTLDKQIPLEQGYAVAMYGWHDREGNQFVWFASKDSFDYQVGEEYRIKATVKRHQTYRGTRQTVISRLKLMEHCYRPFVNPDKELSGHEQTVNEMWDSL